MGELEYVLADGFRRRFPCAEAVVTTGGGGEPVAPL